MAVQREILVYVFTFILCVSPIICDVDSLYCGMDNCYDLLGMDRDSSRTEIVKAYRKLARKWHPDMHRDEDKKKEAGEMFQKIANAYEILRDEDQRNDYNYMLDHPEEYYYNYYRYYKTRTAPKVDVRIVIAVFITAVSVFQYYGAWSNYTAAINYLCKDQKYRRRAIDIAKEENIYPTIRRKDKRGKEEFKEEEEAVIKKVIEENMDIRGGYRKPTYTDVLWVQLVLSPYYLGCYIFWYIRWIWKFNIKREEYGTEEKLYIIRKYLKMGSSQFDALEENDKNTYLHKKLWIKEKFQVWKEQQEEEMKTKLAESSRYKSYRRYMKKGGPGQMTFGPE